MTAEARKAEALTREVRGCFNRLRALGDALHRDLGVTAAMRAVMESLHEAGEQTVPDIARAKNVSRQHIQVLANALTEAGFVAARPNPADKRSPLVALTKRGSAAFARMQQREKAVLADMTRALAGVELDAAVAALAALRAHLDVALKRGESDV
jgi:DNA-binding MarR family transcriptional regulator